MRKILFLKIIFLFFLTLPSIAKDISFIDMDKLMNQSISGISINKKIKNLKEIKTVKINKGQESLKKKESDLISQKNIITTELFNKQLKDLKREVNEFNKMKNIEFKDFEKKKAEYRNKLLNIINPILKDYAKSKNISVLLQKKNIILGSIEHDITNDIIIILNKEIKDIKLKWL